MHSPTPTTTHSTLLSHAGSTPTPPAQSTAHRLSGATERQLLLLSANLLLLLLGFSVAVVSIVLLASFHLPRLAFVSALFGAAPLLLLCAGLVTCCAAVGGLLLWRRRRERSARFRLLAAVLVLACLACLTSCVLSFLLRQSIAHTFSSTSVLGQLRRYDESEAVRSRWDVLQRSYGCCGGGQGGYFDYADETGDVRKVPDSCCVPPETSGCGVRPFSSPVAIPPVDQQVRQEGCMPVIRRSLDRWALPMLMACALMALVAGLIELLLVFAVCCFADHVKRIKDMHRSTLSLERSAGMMGGASTSSSSRQPWQRLQSPSPDSGGGVRVKVPVLESSPSMKQSRLYFHQSVADTIDEESGGGSSAYEAGKGNAADNISTVSYVSGSAAAANVGQATLHPSATKSRFPWLSFLFGPSSSSAGVGGVDKSVDGEIPQSRKDALREEANDREETLMNVLKNVNASHDTHDETDADSGHPTPQQQTKESGKKGGGFSFFGMKSKSSGNVLGSSDSKLNSDEDESPRKKRRNKAKSMEALNQQAAKEHKEQTSGGRWGSGIWNWLTKSRERVDKKDKDEEEEDRGEDFVEVVVSGTANGAAVASGTAASTSAGAELSTALSDSEIGTSAASKPKKDSRISFHLDNEKPTSSSSTGDLVAGAREEERRQQEKSVSVDEGLEQQQENDGSTATPHKLASKKPWFSRFSKKKTEEKGEEGKDGEVEQQRDHEEKNAEVKEDVVAVAKKAEEFADESGGQNLMAAADEEESRAKSPDEKKNDEKKGFRLLSPKWAKRGKDGGGGDDAKQPDLVDAEERTKDVEDALEHATASSPATREPDWSRPAPAERSTMPVAAERKAVVAASAPPNSNSNFGRNYSSSAKISMSNNRKPTETDLDGDDENSNRRTGSKLKSPPWSRAGSVERESERKKEKPPVDRSTKPKRKETSLAAEQAVAISQLEAVLDGSSAVGAECEVSARPVSPSEINTPPRLRRSDLEGGGGRYSGHAAKSRSKSASEEPVKARLRAPAWASSSSSRPQSQERRHNEYVGEPKIRRSSEGPRSRNPGRHKSETDLLRSVTPERGGGRLPSRKPTTIGSSEDILAYRAAAEEEEEEERKREAFKLKLPSFARALSPTHGSNRKQQKISVGGPTSLPHSLTTPTEEAKAQRAAGLLREGAASPVFSKQQEEEFDRVRIAGFGVERLEAKMKASPRLKHAGLQTEEEELKRMPRAAKEVVADEDEARILLIEQEIEDIKGRKKSKKKSVASSTSEAAAPPARKKSVEKGTSTDELVVIPKKKASSEQNMMLARRLTDHNFMNFIKKSSLYGDYKKAKGGGKKDDDKWKGDKVSKAAETTSSEDGGDVARLMVGRGRERTSSDSSRASSEGGGTRRKRTASGQQQQQYYVSRADGSVVYAFESGSPVATADRKRGRSHDELDSITLPFGPTEHFSLEPDLTFLQQSNSEMRTRSSRARSEPKQHQKKASVASAQTLDGRVQHAAVKPRSSATLMAKGGKKTSTTSGMDPDEAWAILQDLKRQENRHLYRTTLEVESVGDGKYSIRRPSGGRGPDAADKASRSKQRDKASSSGGGRRHVSVATMRIRGGEEEV